MPRTRTTTPAPPADLSALRRRGRPAGPVPMCTVAEAAEALAVPVKTVYRWTRERTHKGEPVLPVVRLGSSVRLRVSDVDRLPERLALRPPAPRAVSFFCGLRGQRSKAGCLSSDSSNVEQFARTTTPAQHASSNGQPAIDSGAAGKSALCAEGVGTGPELGGIEAAAAALQGVGDSESPVTAAFSVDSEGIKSVLPAALPSQAAESVGIATAEPVPGSHLTTGGEGVGRARRAAPINPLVEEENFHIAPTPR